MSVFKKGAWAEKPSTQSRWATLYFVLAALDVITVLISFSLNVKLTNEYEESIKANTQWAIRLANYATIAATIGAVNAPGNDIFDTKDVTTERQRMHVALQTFHQELSSSREEIVALNTPETRAIISDFDLINKSVKEMTDEAELIFSFFEQNNASAAGQRMATMDRKFAIASANLALLSQNVRVIQQNIFDGQLARAKSLRKIEYIILVLVSIMLIGALVYGRHMSKAMQRAEDDKLRIEKMKSEFISTVSHELRTPLTSISGALRIILSGSLGEISPASATKMLEIAHKNSLRLSVLVNDLLDFEKISSGKLTFDLKKTSVITLVEQALESSQSYCSERHVALKFVRPLQDPHVNVDGNRFIQVLLNLLSNAIKFSPENGEVMISISTYADTVRVNVDDKGAGIPEAFKQKIFQKFSQADSSDTRQKGGTGLGLSISKELIEGMKGKIGFESQEGKGSTFYIELPKTHEANETKSGEV